MTPTLDIRARLNEEVSGIGALISIWRDTRLEERLVGMTVTRPATAFTRAPGARRKGSPLAR